MRTVLVGLVVITGGLLAVYLLQQVVVERSLGPAAMLVTALLGTVFLALFATLLLSRTRHRFLVVNLWLAASSVALSYLVLDLASGYILIRPLSPPLVPDAARHHKMVPSSYSEFQQRDFSYVQRVNALGLRGREIATQKAPGTFRIVMLGDSFTMGKGVEDNQTFSVVLEQLINKDRAACGTPIEIVNGGVDSYAPVIEFIQLKKDLAPLKPDMVILNLDVSDLTQEAAYRAQAERGPGGDIVAVPQYGDPDNLMAKVRIWTERHLFFTRAALYYAIRSLGYRELTVRDVVNRADAETAAHTLVGDVDRAQEWRDIFESLTNIKEYCQQRGIEFLLTVYPWAHQISPTEWTPGRYAFMARDAVPSDTSLQTIHSLSRANGIKLLDLFPAFRASLGSDPLYFAHDMHWTPAGHRAMARGLEEYLSHEYSKHWCR